MTDTDKNNKRRGVFIAILLLLLLIIIFLLFLLLRPAGGRDAFTASGRDPNAQLGQYEGKSPEEIQEDLNRTVEEGMFNISINSTVTVNGRQAELRIENIQENRHLMSVQITLDDTGEAVYTSGLIEPGYYIQYAPLECELKAGVYEATAIFTACDMESGAELGKAATKIKLIVEE